MNRRPFARLAGAGLVLALSASAFAQDAAKSAPEPGRMDKIIGLVVGFVLAVVALFISLGLAMKAVSIAFGMFDKLTKGVDEWAELKKGNVAIGLLMAAVIYAIGHVISSGVTALTTSLMNPALNLAYLLSIIVGIVNLLIALWVGTYVIGLTIKILDKMTENIEEMEEIAKGNVAVAILVTGVLLAVSNVVAQGVEGISKIVNVQSVASAFGLHI